LNSSEKLIINLALVVILSLKYITHETAQL